MAEGYLDSKFTIPPDQREGAINTVVEGTPPTTETQPPAEQPPAETKQTDTGAVAGTTTEAPPDKFFDELNKRFSSSFKTEDEVRNILGMPLKITELEGKVKLAEDYATKIENYEKQIEEIKNNGNTEFLSKPLIRKAYVADQLLAKYPDKDPFTLQEIVMADVSKMSDLDVLVKNQKINHPQIAEGDIRAALCKKHGIDPDTKPEEWDSVTRAELAMSADDARANIKALTNGIELPKAVTKEERDQAATQATQQRIQTAEPLKAEFTAFDKFKDGDFEYDVPSDYKSSLGKTFDAMFIQGGMEPTPENRQTAIELRNAMFLLNNFSKIREVITKQAQTAVQKKVDVALNNDTPPNTKTATDEGGQEQTLPGLSKFLTDNK
jgi:hypothetical protein